MIKIKLYTDPGHGWGAVKIAVARELGFLEKVSLYSYVRGKTLYLEEAGDLSLYCAALNAKGETYEFVVKHTDLRHPIRSYDSANNKNILKAVFS
jgi:hypothetical protein